MSDKESNGKADSMEPSTGSIDLGFGETMRQLEARKAEARAKMSPEDRAAAEAKDAEARALGDGLAKSLNETVEAETPAGRSHRPIGPSTPTSPARYPSAHEAIKTFARPFDPAERAKLTPEELARAEERDQRGAALAGGLAQSLNQGAMAVPPDLQVESSSQSTEAVVTGLPHPWSPLMTVLCCLGFIAVASISGGFGLRGDPNVFEFFLAALAMVGIWRRIRFGWGLALASAYIGILVNVAVAALVTESVSLDRFGKWRVILWPGDEMIYDLPFTAAWLGACVAVIVGCHASSSRVAMRISDRTHRIALLLGAIVTIGWFVLVDLSVGG